MFGINPVYTRVLWRELSREGFTAEAFFTGTSLDEQRIYESGNISLANFSTILENARTLTGNEQIGFMLGQHSNALTLGSLGAAMAVAPNLREGLQLLESYTRLHTSYAEVGLLSELRGFSVSLVFQEVEGFSERAHVEAGMQLLRNFSEAICGCSLEGVEYQFAYPRPAYAKAYKQHLMGQHQFDCPEHRTIIPRAYIDAPSVFYNPEIWHESLVALAQRLKAATEEEENTYTRHVRALLRSFEPPLPDLQAVAERLHVSPRTLNRRLRDESTSFRELRAGELQTWAKRYLAQTQISVEAIAGLLGYEDASNFRRAFRNWENCSPAEYRASL
jgi:AraC-like DNA-binding protein